jgi:hypothetical protein
MWNNSAGRSRLSGIAVATILCAFGLAPSDAAAQTAAPEASSPANDLRVGPNAPASQVPRTPTTAQTTGKPANVCAELKAHVQLQQSEAAASSTNAPGQNAAVQRAGDQPAADPQQRASQSAASAGQTGAQASVDKAQQNSGLSSPVPPSAPGGKVTVALSDVEQMVAAGDQHACQTTVQRLRRAGAVLPPSLIALAALKADLLHDR